MMRTQIGHWLQRLTSDEGQLEADSLANEADSAGATRADCCRAGEKAEILGRLRTVQLQPCDTLAALVAELYDGSDTVELIWLGRRSIAGIEAGRTVRVRGRIAERDGRKAMYNPTYQLMPGTV